MRAKSLPPTAIGGGGSLSEGEADIRLWDSALPGIGEEHAATGIVAGVWQPDDSGGSTGGLTRRPAGPSPSVERLWTRYSPARGEIIGGGPSAARTRDASHTRIQAQEPKDRQSRPLVQSIPRPQTKQGARMFGSMRPVPRSLPQDPMAGFLPFGGIGKMKDPKISKSYAGRQSTSRPRS